MFKQLVVAAAAALAFSSAFAGIGQVNGTPDTGDVSVASPYDLGVLTTAPTVLTVSVFGAPGTSFEEYANFSISTLSEFGIGANTYTLSLIGINVLEIQDLQVEVWDGAHPGGSTLLAAFSGNNTSASFELAAGNYHVDISGTFGPTASAGQYSVAMSAAPVPEPGTYALMLAGLGAMGFVARRRRV